MSLSKPVPGSAQQPIREGPGGAASGPVGGGMGVTLPNSTTPEPHLVRGNHLNKGGLVTEKVYFSHIDAFASMEELW